MSTNLFAGMGSHQSAKAKTDEWLTPPEILAALGPFDLDPCAPVTPPWPIAARHFTVEDNGLLRQWEGRVWLNPPYGNQTGRWLARLVTHGIGTALIFARTETEFFFKHVWHDATALLFLEGRLNFHFVDGRRATHNSGAPSVLAAYGAIDAERLSDSGLDGKFIPLRVPRIVALICAAQSETWRDAVLGVMNRRRGPVPLDELYLALCSHPKAQRNQHWREKIRQVLQQGPFERIDRGVWKLNTEVKR